MNLFNDNITLNVPLGQPFTINGTLSYAFVASYATNAWDSGYSVYEFYNSDGFQTREVPYRYPSEHSNAGMAWMVTFGKLWTPPGSDSRVYVSPDGSQHRFHSSLRGDADTTAATYTRDGTYIRKTISGSDTILEIPDGTRHTFATTTGRFTGMTSVNAQGSTPLTYQWFAITNTGLLPIENATSPIVFVSPTRTTTYRARVTIASRGTDTHDVKVNVVDPPAVPTAVTATYTPALGGVLVTWTASSGPLALAFADDPILTPGDGAEPTIIRGVHISDLRRAIDALRRLARLTPVWTEYSPPTGVIQRTHFVELLNALNEARGELSRPAVVLPNAVLGGAAVHGRTIRELRDGLR